MAYIRDKKGRLRYRKGMVLPATTDEDRKRREAIFRDMVKRRPPGVAPGPWKRRCRRQVFGR